MLLRFFNNFIYNSSEDDSSEEESNQNTNKNDEEFLKNMLKNMQVYQSYEQKNYDDIYNSSASSTAYTAPEISTKLDTIRLALDSNNKRMNTLKKILSNQPITRDEQLFLLKDKLFENSIASRYANIVEQSNSPKPFQSI